MRTSGSSTLILRFRHKPQPVLDLPELPISGWSVRALTEVLVQGQGNGIWPADLEMEVKV